MEDLFPHQLPVALTIAGSDSGGGAGIQADLKAFHCLGVFGTSAITAITAQNPYGVRSMQAVAPALIKDQIDAVFDAFSMGAIKTGMLFNAETIETVVERLAACSIPVVVDPVMVATSGAVLLQNDALEVLTSSLLTRATIITPNLPEASLLLNRAMTVESAARAAEELADIYGCAVLVKGGHDAKGDRVVDWLADNHGVHGISTPKVEAKTTHGTGCALSAAIAAGMATSLSLLDAVVHAKAYIYGNLSQCRQVGANTFAMTPSDILPLASVSTS